MYETRKNINVLCTGENCIGQRGHMFASEVITAAIHSLRDGWISRAASFKNDTAEVDCRNGMVGGQRQIRTVPSRPEGER